MSDVKKDIPEYSFEKKKRLASKISNMKNKENLKKIKDIIFKENPDISVRKNSRGMLMYFQNFTVETYYKLDKLLIKIEADRVKKQTKTITETSDKMIYSSEEPMSTTDYSRTRTRLRYSNVEKKLIKRLEYEKLIKNNKKVMLSNSDKNTDNKKGKTNKKIVRKKNISKTNTDVNIFTKT